MAERSNSRAAKKAAKRTEIADRRRKVAALALARMTLVQIQSTFAETGYQVGVATLGQDMKAIRADWRASALLDFAQAQEQELAALASDETRLRGCMAKLAQAEHKARVAYQEAILKVMAARARILGTDAPVRIQTQSAGPASIAVVWVDDWNVRPQIEDASESTARPTDIVGVATVKPLPSNGNGNGNGAAHV